MDNCAQAALGAHCLNVVTAVTAQNNAAVLAINPVAENEFRQQLEAVAAFECSALKSGLIGSATQVALIAEQAALSGKPYVCDPVLAATSGGMFSDAELLGMYGDTLIPVCTLITPNLDEAARLTGIDIDKPEGMLAASEALCSMGAGAVYIKGGHAASCDSARDLFFSAGQQFWLSSPWQDTPNTRGTGCAFASSVAAALALGYALPDAVVIGKMAINQGLRNAFTLEGGQKGAIRITHFPAEQADLPYLTVEPEADLSLPAFPPCALQPLGLYPVVDSADWLARLLPLGVTTAQLRVKELQGEALEQEVARAIELGREHNCRLFINDHWQLAIEHGAYGVHLGQEDIGTADIAAIHAAGLRLGTSTHCHYEVARAHALKPSYVACGPVYETTTKDMPWVPHDIAGLQYWLRVLDYPLVAIGGINAERIAGVAATGVSGVAMITAITLADDPEQTTRDFLERVA